MGGGNGRKFRFQNSGERIRCWKSYLEQRMSEAKPVHRYLNLNDIDQLRDAAYETDSGASERDEVLVVVLADLGLRVSEAVALRRTMFDFKAGEVTLPAGIQKDYPHEDVSPSSVRMELDPLGEFGTERLLKRYFRSDWWQDRPGDYVFPSRQSEQMTAQTARNITKRLAARGDVSPRRTDGEAADPGEMHPHALRHSLASYMLRDRDTRLIDVRNRLRHRSIQTTEQVYEHFRRR